MDSNKTIEEIEKELGLDKIQGACCLTPSCQEDLKKDDFNELYEEELKTLYRKIKNNKF